MKNGVQKVNVAINHFRAGFFFFFFESKQHLLAWKLKKIAYVSKCSFQRSGLFFVNSSEANNPKNDNYCLNNLASLQQPLRYTFQTKCLRFALRRNKVRKVNVVINHFRAALFLRASNTYYTSIRTRKAAPCTIFNKSKCLL